MLLPDVAADHAAEAAFLWYLRELAAVSPVHGPQNLADLDERVAAHLDALFVNGAVGVAACKAGFASHPRSREAFPLAWLAAASGSPDLLAEVAKAADAEPATIPGIAAALSWLGAEHVATAVTALWSTGPGAKRAVLAGIGDLRADPGDLISRGCRDEDADVRIAAWASAARLGRRDLATTATTALTMEHPGERAAAACALAIATPAAPPSALLRAAMTMPGAIGDLAVDLFTRLLPTEQVDPEVVRPHAGRSFRAALGRGTVAEVNRLVALLALHPARYAFDAILTITGVDPKSAGLTGHAPAEDPSAGLALDPHRDAPWPDVAAVTAWWNAFRGNLDPGCRYLAGQAVNLASCTTLAACADQRTRGLAALELAIFGHPWPATGAPSPLALRGMAVA